MNTKEVENLQAAFQQSLEENAVPLIEIDLTRENYTKLFPMGKIETPVETVKLGKNQFEKLQQNDRNYLLGAMYDTLSNPHVILEKETYDEKTEEFKPVHVYGKSFYREDKNRSKIVESVIIFRDGDNISIGTHNKDIDRFVKQIKTADNIIFSDKDVSRVAMRCLKSQTIMDSHVRLDGINTEVLNKRYALSNVLSIDEIRSTERQNKFINYANNKIDGELFNTSNATVILNYLHSQDCSLVITNDELNVINPSGKTIGTSLQDVLHIAKEINSELYQNNIDEIDFGNQSQLIRQKNTQLEQDGEIIRKLYNHVSCYDDLKHEISNTFQSFSNDETEAAISLLSARSETLGMTLDVYLSEFHPDGLAVQEFGLDKGYKGYVSFLEQDTKAIIHAGESADFSTFVHEAAHIFRRQLTGELLKKAENAFGVSNGQWSEEQEEKFAVGLEEFIRTRTETNTDKKVVYEKGSKFIQNVYSDVEKIIDISPEMQEVYESLFNKADDKKISFIINQYESSSNLDILYQRKLTSKVSKEEKEQERIQKIADYFIKSIETNTAPWMKPWKASEYVTDFNPVTGNTYTGFNALYLPMVRSCDFKSDDPRWFTFNNAHELGYTVKKGEKSTSVDFYKHIGVDANGKAVPLDEEGNPKKEIDHYVPIRKTYSVFHASQVGILERDDQEVPIKDEDGNFKYKPIPEFVKNIVPVNEFNSIEKADELINKTGVTIINDQGDRSFFRPSTDVIHLCPKNMYDSPEAYYGTVLHELTHWTGVESRLNRDSLKDYEIRENRAREELIAEIGSYQLCKSLHLDFSPQNNIAYVQGWVKALHNSPEEIFKATTAAAAAKEFITNIEGEKVLEHEIKSPNLTPKLKSYEDQISDIVTTAMKYNKEPWNKSIGNETVIPPYNPVSGQIYEPAILDTHAAINGHSDKRYLSSNDIHECNKTIVENSNPIVIAHTKGNVVKYDMLFNVEEINDIPKTKLPSLVSKTECKLL